MVTFLEIITDVENISGVTNQRTLIKGEVRRALSKFFQAYDWPFYIQDKGVIATLAVYETGTVSVTNGSTTVTGSGTTFTSAMVGRKMRINSETPFYRIGAFVSTTELTLEQAYQGSTASAQTYEIYKDEYRLAADVDKYKILRQLQNGVALFDYAPTDFDSIYPMPNSYSDPIKSIMIGTKLDTYSTGTVSASGSTITGSSTSWTSVEGLGRMSKIRTGSNVYTIKSVDSDTQITVYEVVIAVAAGATYEIILNNLLVQLYNIPDTARLLYYRYFRIPALLYNDYDVPDMPYNYEGLLVDGALIRTWRQKGDKEQSILSGDDFRDGIRDAILKIGSFSPDRIYKRKSIDRVRTTTDGLEKSNFDKRYSSPGF